MTEPSVTDGVAAASIFCDVVCALGEGPAAHPALGRLYWFDIIGQRLLERPLSGAGKTTVHALPFMASVMAVIDDDRQLILSEHGLHIRDVATGTLTDYMPVEADNPVTRSNDGRVHPAGALWFGTMGKHAEDGAGAVYWFFKGELRKLYDGISIINSISFAPDGSAAYFADSRLRTIWRVPTDPTTGLPTGDRQVFVSYPDSASVPDGSVTDARGWLWNARWDGGVLEAYDLAGKRVRQLALPARQVSCPAFVGPNSGRIVVTSATQGMDAEALAADPLAGHTFVVDTGEPIGRFDPPVLLG